VPVTIDDMNNEQAKEETTSPGRREISMRIACSAGEILDAQRLRYRVFAEELGAKLPHAAFGVDRDRFDRWCDHLIVLDDTSGRVIGTYRILPASRIGRAGGFYSDTEFDTRRLQALGGQVLEVGRACIDPAYRSGAVLGMLWAGLARYIKSAKAKYVIGCASIPVGPDPMTARTVCRQVLADYAAPSAWQVTPYRPFPLTEQAPPSAAPSPAADIPALLKGYLRLGARVCGEPAFDEQFGTADLLILLSVAEMNSRYAARLFRAA
jgi:putative hemolysin